MSNDHVLYSNSGSNSPQTGLSISRYDYNEEIESAVSELMSLELDRSAWSFHSIKQNVLISQLKSDPSSSSLSSHRYSNHNLNAFLYAPHSSAHLKGFDSKKRRRKELQRIRGQGVVHAPPETTFNCISDLDMFELWDGFSSERKVLAEYVLGGENNKSLVRIVYIRFKGLFPLASRDVCICTCKRIIEESSIESDHDQGSFDIDKEGRKAFLLAAFSINHPSCPPVPGYVRAELDASGFIIRPHKNKSCSEVTFMLQFDAKGWLPNALQNLISEYQPLRIAKIRDIVRNYHNRFLKTLSPLTSNDEHKSNQQEYEFLQQSYEKQAILNIFASSPTRFQWLHQCTGAAKEEEEFVASEKLKLEMATETTSSSTSSSSSTITRKQNDNNGDNDRNKNQMLENDQQNDSKREENWNLHFNQDISRTAQTMSLYHEQSISRNSASPERRHHRKSNSLPTSKLSPNHASTTNEYHRNSFSNDFMNEEGEGGEIEDENESKNQRKFTKVLLRDQEESRSNSDTQLMKNNHSDDDIDSKDQLEDHTSKVGSMNRSPPKTTQIIASKKNNNHQDNQKNNTRLKSRRRDGSTQLSFPGNLSPDRSNHQNGLSSASHHRSSPPHNRTSPPRNRSSPPHLRSSPPGRSSPPNGHSSPSSSSSSEVLVININNINDTHHEPRVFKNRVLASSSDCWPSNNLHQIQLHSHPIESDNDENNENDEEYHGNDNHHHEDEDDHHDDSDDEGDIFCDLPNDSDDTIQLLSNSNQNSAGIETVIKFMTNDVDHIQSVQMTTQQKMEIIESELQKRSINLDRITSQIDGLKSFLTACVSKLKNLSIEHKSIEQRRLRLEAKWTAKLGQISDRITESEKGYWTRRRARQAAVTRWSSTILLVVVWPILFINVWAFIKKPQKFWKLIAIISKFLALILPQPRQRIGPHR